MATKTLTQANRPFDHLYDPTYVTASHTDHYRSTSRAMVCGRPLDRVPDDRYMFSELPHYPRAGLRMSHKDMVPRHVPMDWTPPNMKSVPGKDSTEVHGKSRHKFFARPNKQMLSTIPHIVQYAMRTAPQVAGVTQKGMASTAEPRTKTVGTQSMYRESEAQTDPYSPEYYVVPNQSPEVLQLMHLCYGAGLPATEAEIKAIERTRQKRLFERMLPPPTDEFNLEVRSALMEAQEFREWAERERTIRDLQERRLDLLREALHDRSTRREVEHDERVERMRTRKEEDRDRVQAACQRRKTTVLRKMQKERTKAEPARTAPEPGRTGKRDVIAEYAEKSSKVYAPLARDGHVPDSNTSRIEIQPADLNTYPGLLALENALPSHVLKPVKISPHDSGKKKTKHQVRKENEITSALKAAMESIKKEMQQPTEAEVPNMRVDRAESPRKEEVQPEDEEMEAAVLLLQRVIRGRAYQNMMFEGKDKRLDLINELRAAERFAETATTVEEKRYSDQLKEKAFEGAIESIQGSVISQTLDQLSKELLRFQQEKRIAVMVKLAERDRQIRQAQESGRRQAEERLREREDEMFRKIMGVHQSTVDSYLEEVLTSTVEQAAQSRALTEARLKAAKINQVVDTLEAATQEPEAVVRELVHNFMLPHVRREVVKRREAVESKRFSEAARCALDDTYLRVQEELQD